MFRELYGNDLHGPIGMFVNISVQFLIYNHKCEVRNCD